MLQYFEKKKAKLLLYSYSFCLEFFILDFEEEILNLQRTKRRINCWSHEYQNHFNH